MKLESKHIYPTKHFFYKTVVFKVVAIFISAFRMGVIDKLLAVKTQLGGDFRLCDRINYLHELAFTHSWAVLESNEV